MVNSTSCIRVSSEGRIIVNVSLLIVAVLLGEFTLKFYIRFHKVGENWIQIPINV